MIENAQPASGPTWNAFKAKHHGLIEASGLPAVIVDCIEHWSDFLTHGYLDRVEDPSDFTVEDLQDTQYAALKEMVIEYFKAGFAFVVPIALAPPDYMEIAKQFGGARDRREA